MISDDVSGLVFVPNRCGIAHSFVVPIRLNGLDPIHPRYQQRDGSNVIVRRAFKQKRDGRPRADKPHVAVARAMQMVKNEVALQFHRAALF